LKSTSPLNGLIILNKPVGITSAKALYRVRRLTGQRKSGHAGTLDPGASGLLVLCLGEATKLVESIMDQPKVYRATARLDVTSESFDADEPLQPVEVSAVPSYEAVVETFGAFEGVIEQIPPRISAIKIGGQPAYKLARRSQAVELKPRPVTIHWVCVHTYEWPMLDFEMCCSRGTYVRSLIRDVGQRLKTGGCLMSLVRRRVGPFTEDNAHTFEDIEAAKAPSGYVISLDQAKTTLDRRAMGIPRRPL